MELVGAVGLGLSGIGLRGRDVSSAYRQFDARVDPELTRLMTLEGDFLSPTKRRPLPVSAAQAMLVWAVSADFSALR